ncbi:MAG: response regulator, partial [Chloroflexota bacterium]
TRQLAERVLVQIGYEVVVASGGQEALERLARERFGLVVMDIAMPDMDGVTTARHIRALEGPNRDVPILAMTGLSDEDAHQHIMAAGVNAVLTKPIALDTLRTSVRRWVRVGSNAGHGAQHGVA